MNFQVLKSMNSNEIKINCPVCNKLITTNEKNDSVTCECGAFWYLDLDQPHFLSTKWKYWASVLKCSWTGERYNVIYRRLSKTAPQGKFAVWLMYGEVNKGPFIDIQENKIPLPLYLLEAPKYSSEFTYSRGECLSCGYKKKSKVPLIINCGLCGEDICASQTYETDDYLIFVCHSSCGRVGKLMRNEKNSIETEARAIAARTKHTLLLLDNTNEKI